MLLSGAPKSFELKNRLSGIDPKSGRNDASGDIGISYENT
jgi:hypothetical protein